MASRHAGSRNRGRKDDLSAFLGESVEKDEKQFRLQLRDFPHTFMVEHDDEAAPFLPQRVHCRKLIALLQADLEAGQPTPLETARCLNLLAYFLLLQGEPREALGKVEKALELPGEEQNLVSKANRAVILWKLSQRKEAEKQIDELKQLKEQTIAVGVGLKNVFPYLVIRARAELAFTYSRFGGRFFTRKAIDAFTEVLPQAQEPELWLWKFGLALSQRRLDWMIPAPVSDDAENTNLITVLETLTEIINKCNDNSLKAKCYAEVAQVLFSRQSCRTKEKFKQVIDNMEQQSCSGRVQRKRQSDQRYQRFEGERSRQNVDDARPRQYFQGAGPRQNFDDARSRQYFQGARPRQNFEGANPRPNFKGESSRDDGYRRTLDFICTKALKLDSADSSVLWKVAKVYRCTYRMEKAVELLKKSLQLRPTSTEYHQLGLALDALAKKARRNKDKYGTGYEAYDRRRQGGEDGKRGGCGEQKWQGSNCRTHGDDVRKRSDDVRGCEVTRRGRNFKGRVGQFRRQGGDVRDDEFTTGGRDVRGRGGQFRQGGDVRDDEFMTGGRDVRGQGGQFKRQGGDVRDDEFMTGGRDVRGQGGQFKRQGSDVRDDEFTTGGRDVRGQGGQFRQGGDVRDDEFMTGGRDVRWRGRGARRGHAHFREGKANFKEREAAFIGTPERRPSARGTYPAISQSEKWKEDTSESEEAIRHSRRTPTNASQLNPCAPAFEPSSNSYSSLAATKPRFDTKRWDTQDSKRTKIKEFIGAPSADKDDLFSCVPPPEPSSKRERSSSREKRDDFMVGTEEQEDDSDSEEGAVGFADTLVQRLEDPGLLSLDSGFLTGPTDMSELSSRLSGLSMNQETVQMRNYQAECSQFSNFSYEGDMLDQESSLTQEKRLFPGLSNTDVAEDETRNQTLSCSLLDYVVEQASVNVGGSELGSFSDQGPKPNASLETSNSCPPSQVEPSSSFLLATKQTSPRHSLPKLLVPSPCSSLQQSGFTDGSAVQESGTAEAVSSANIQRQSSQTTEPIHCVQKHQKFSEAASPMPTKFEIQTMKKVVKSPLITAQYSRKDPFVTEAIQAFEKSVELSGQTNTRAVYDLALVHRGLGEHDRALTLLDQIMDTRHDSSPFERVSTFEQAGLILKEMSEEELDEKKRDNLRQESESKLEMALLLCSRMCLQLPRFQYFIKHSWNSFAVLMKAVDTKGCPQSEKFKEKAKLLQLIRENLESSVHLQALLKSNPEERNKPDYVWLLIKNLVDLQDYREAMRVFLLHKITLQGYHESRREENHYYSFARICILTGREALRNATSKKDLDYVKVVFSSAFAEFDRIRMNEDNDDEMSSTSEDSEYSDEEGEDCIVHVMFVHDDAAEVQAQALAEILQDVCGLGVKTCSQDDYMPGRPFLNSLSQTLSKSRMAVVLASVASRLSRGVTCVLLNLAAKKRCSVTLQLDDGGRVPKLMQGKRSRVCPGVLLQTVGEASHDASPASSAQVCDSTLASSAQAQTDDGAEAGWRGYSPLMVEGICDLFCFLTDTEL